MRNELGSEPAAEPRTANHCAELPWNLNKPSRSSGCQRLPRQWYRRKGYTSVAFGTKLPSLNNAPLPKLARRTPIFPHRAFAHGSHWVTGVVNWKQRGVLWSPGLGLHQIHHFEPGELGRVAPRAQNDIGYFGMSQVISAWLVGTSVCFLTLQSTPGPAEALGP